MAITATVIPQPTPAAEHARCNHGHDDTTGYVVAYSHLDPATGEVTFTDIAYVRGAVNYGRALDEVRKARRAVLDGVVDAAWAVIHHVYSDGHRMF